MSKKIRLSLLVLMIVIAIFTAWRMYSLNSAQELWGHLPLYSFVAAWLSLLLLRINRKSAPKQHLRWLGLSTLTGILLSVGFPPIPLPFLMFIGFVPLLFVEKEIGEQYENSTRKLLPYAYNTFVIWNILTTWWVANTALVAGIVAIWLNAFLMCIPFLLFHFSKKKSPRTTYLGFIAYWLVFEWVHLNWEISWVWLNLGNAFASIPSLVQWYEYTGTFGGSLWILITNVLLFKILHSYFNNNKANIKADAVQLGGLILIPIVLSLAIYTSYEEQGESIEVIVGQPNYEPHFKKFDIPKAVRDQEIIDLAMKNISSTTEYFIYPETVFNNVDEDKPENNATVRLFQPILDKYPNVKIVAGVSAHNILKDYEKDTKSTRKVYDRYSGKLNMRYESLNAALQMQKDKPIQTYRKSVFVPGAEILPYKKYLFWLKPLVDKLDGSMEGLGTQTQRSVFESDKAKVAPAICYESVFGEYSTGYIRKGADFIAIMTNDGWWDNTAGHKQHLAFARLRAIETRRDIARSANTGISAFINQRGEITSQTKYDERIALKGNVRLNKKNTFYTRWQDLIARIAIFTALLLLLNTFVKGILKK